MVAAWLLFSQYMDSSWERSHQPFPSLPRFLAVLVPPAEVEGGSPFGEEGTVEQRHLLGVVVVVVVDVDGCCDPADDEGDPTSDQVEPVGGEQCHHVPAASPRDGTGLYSRARPAPASGCGAGEAPLAPVGSGRGEGVLIPQHGSGGRLGHVPVRLPRCLPGHLLVEHSGFDRHPQQGGEGGVVQDDADLRGRGDGWVRGCCRHGCIPTGHRPGVSVG